MRRLGNSGSALALGKHSDEHDDRGRRMFPATKKTARSGERIAGLFVAGGRLTWINAAGRKPVK
jgi:hypothetical protein